MYWTRKIRSNVNLKASLPIPGGSLGLVSFFIWYVPAIYVGISRSQVNFYFKNILNNFKDYRHFPTDILAGAVIGTFSVYVSFITYYDFSLFHPQLYEKIAKKTENTELQQNSEIL